jgi:hypothetical protein
VTVLRLWVKALVPVIALLTMLIPVSSGLAATHRPNGEFAPLADCPLGDPSVELCILAEMTGGEMAVGKRVIPITAPILVQGGLIENEIESFEFVGAEDGKTLSKTALTVPGGLLGVVGASALSPPLHEASNGLLGRDATAVIATIELAKPASSIGFNLNNMVDEQGTAVELPVKVKLSNAFLGDKCYLGSEAHPIVLRLTVGATSPSPPNRSLRGHLGEISFNKAFTLATIDGVSLVDNTFAVPGATGCGTSSSLLVDRAVDVTLGLPSPAGYNTGILTGKLWDVIAGAVLESE